MPIQFMTVKQVLQKEIQDYELIRYPVGDREQRITRIER
jgi:hypothetical protein